MMQLESTGSAIADPVQTADRPENLATARQRMIRRFAATVGHPKPLIVTYRGISDGRCHTATGLPHAVCGEVIYVTTRPGIHVGIPKFCVLTIEPLYPRRSCGH